MKNRWLPTSPDYSANAGLIEWNKFPPYFTQDSIERQIFKPETDTHCTFEQARALLSDAKFYVDPNGPDMCPTGLKASARAVIRKLAWLDLK